MTKEIQFSYDFGEVLIPSKLKENASKLTEETTWLTVFVNMETTDLKIFNYDFFINLEIWNFN